MECPTFFTGGIKQGGLKNHSRSVYTVCGPMKAGGRVDDGRDYLTK
jgi:hypothetical protein